MNRPALLRPLTCLARVASVASCLAVFAFADVPAADHPNVLMIVVDDLNDWIGCLDGHPQAWTPNIDRLAARGILFTNAHCASPACNPSRAAVFSGQMPWRTGVWSNDSKRLLRQHPHKQVLPHAFRNAGYHALGTGKLMHSGAAANRVMFQDSYNVEQRWSPLTRKAVAYTDDDLATKGSDNPRHRVLLPGGRPIILPLNRMPSDRNPHTYAGESFDWGPMDVADDSMGDTRITDWAIEHLTTPSETPWFLAVGYYRPHIPLWAPKKYFARLANQKIELPPNLDSDLDDLTPIARRWAIQPITAGLHQTVVEHDQWHAAVKAYLACTTYVDAQIGRLLRALDNGGDRDNTVIVFWTDHGWHLGEKQHWGKWTGWERSTRVPMVIVPPKRLATQFAAAGSRCDNAVSLIDLYPTLTDMCHLQPPPKLDGMSLVPLLRDPRQDSDRIVTTAFGPGNVSLRDRRWRYVRYVDGSEELYDMQHDIHEWTNLSKHPQFASVLREFRTTIPSAALAQPGD